MTKILVIEADAILREMVIEWSKLEGYETMGAVNGVEGVAAAFRQLPDLIICDVAVPLLDGYGVLLELHSNPSTSEIPFVFVTATLGHDDSRHGMSVGADDYIIRPFARIGLVEAVKVRLQKKTIQFQAHQHEIEAWQQALDNEREQRLLKAKMAAMFAHEFRNPLSIILAASNLLHAYYEQLDEKRRSAQFQRIDASVHRLVEMLDDMLSVAKMESDKFEFKPQPLNAGDFFQRMVKEFQAIYEQTHTLLFENHLTEVLMADPNLLRPIAANLLSNAIKYSPQGGSIHITLAEHDGQCVFSVKDQGIGILPADQQQLFTEFHRGSNVGSLPGTGLGLAIARRAADLHGGSVRLENNVSKGATATMIFPLQLANTVFSTIAAQ